ncbi:hypothetical protein N7508_005061 [Penicillium antarcticum]|uniref:uncharacterized protein n=1 Tax=Penicillium antarcticum TaxID=416450 RepID=UPI0023A2ACCA|nr:uncharacterized protein N7508_005061 [Penicillium antarcticum]KAJ5306046.1 hypothetical protein N7508_005061 [Penicillium antarcticum]
MPMFDPPSEDTASTIAEAQDLGISVKVLTGYATAISKGTCKMLAMGRKFCNSKRLVGGLNGAMAGEMVEKADGFAEDFPEHKYQVVDMLQECGHLTAMADDGANDAPSLKKAMWYCRGSSLPQTPGLSTIIDSINVFEWYYTPCFCFLELMTNFMQVVHQIFQQMKAYIQYHITICLHLEKYLVTTMIVINESLRT